MVVKEKKKNDGILLNKRCRVIYKLYMKKKKILKN